MWYGMAKDKQKKGLYFMALSGKRMVVFEKMPQE